MAFDLKVTAFKPGKAGERTRDKLQRLVDKSGGESWGRDSESFGIGISRLTDKQVARFYAALVKLATREGLAVYDPQAGEDVCLETPSRLPPGWTPPEPMDAEHFGRCVQGFVRKYLEPLGYSPTACGAERLLDDGHLLQRITFQAKKDLLSVLIDWRFFFDGKEDSTWPAPIDICDYILGSPLEADWPVALRAPRWGQLSAAKSDLDASLARINHALREIVHPLLASIATIELLVEAFEDGRLGAIARYMKEDGQPPRETLYMAFGYSPIGTARNMALSYRHLGRLEEGKRRYQDSLTALGNPASLMSTEDQATLAEAEALFG